jgi:hypothetical protein
MRAPARLLQQDAAGPRLPGWLPQLPRAARLRRKRSMVRSKSAKSKSNKAPCGRPDETDVSFRVVSPAVWLCGVRSSVKAVKEFTEPVFYPTNQSTNLLMCLFLSGQIHPTAPCVKQNYRKFVTLLDAKIYSCGSKK